MLGETLEVLGRAKAILGDQSNWFETACEWYKKTTLTRKAVAEMLNSNRPQDRLLVFVNGQMLAAASQVTDLRGRRVTWLVPSNRLKQGPNEIVVQVDRHAPAALVVLAASFEQDYYIPWQTLILAEPQPPAAPNLALSGQKHASCAGRNWSVDAGGFVQFRLMLPTAAPVNFTLHLDQSYASVWLAMLRDLARELRDEIREAVKEKLWELEGQLEQAWRQGRASVRSLKDDYRVLTAYQRLHRQHLQPALEGPADGTLQEIIAHHGSPEALIGSGMGDAPFVRPEELPMVKPVEPRQLPVATKAPARPPVRSTVGVGGCLALILVLLAVAGTAALIAWQNNDMQDWVKKTFGGDAKKRNPSAAAGPAIAELLKSKKANNGEVQITLHWTNKNDLDLHVVCPSGQEINFESPKNCEGALDLDANRSYDTATAGAVENIFWPAGKAPRGNYKIYVVHFHNPGKPDCQDPTTFTVRLVIRGQTQFFTGQVDFANPNRRKVLVHEFTLQ